MLENSAVIEFIDTDESNTSLIMNTPSDMDPDLKYSHCEIHPLIIGSSRFYNSLFKLQSSTKKRIRNWTD